MYMIGRFVVFSSRIPFLLGLLFILNHSVSVSSPCCPPAIYATPPPPTHTSLSISLPPFLYLSLSICLSLCCLKIFLFTFLLSHTTIRFVSINDLAFGATTVLFISHFVWLVISVVRNCLCVCVSSHILNMPNNI